MVELNVDRSRPEHVLDLTRIAELARWERDGGRPRIGAGVTHSRLIAELGNRLPGLAAAVAALRAATGRPLTRIPVRPEHIVL